MSMRGFASTKLKSSANLKKSLTYRDEALCYYLKTHSPAFAYSTGMALQQMVTSEYERGLQRGMERQVITLLHHAHKPGALALLPLMGSLCLATGESNPVAALERIVCSALPDDDANGKSLRGAILDADFRRCGTNGQLAQRRGLSRRHFQRLRAEAIARIARRVRGIAEPAFLATPASRQLRSTGLDWRIDREREAFRDAHAHGNSLEMRCIAGNLLRLAATGETRSFAWDCRAEANLRLGHIDETLGHIELCSPAAQHSVRATLALLAGDLEKAERHALACMGVEQDERARYAANALLSQIRLDRARPWDAPDVRALSPSSWERCAMECERSRHLAVRGEWFEGERLALATHARASTRGYREVAARCAAVLAAAAQRRGDISTSQQWGSSAIAQLLPTLNRVAAPGIFLWKSCSGSHRLGDALTGVLYERLCVVVPQIGRDDGAWRAVVCKLLASAIEAELSGEKFSHATEEWRCPPRFIEAVAEMLALAVTAFARLPWNVALERFRERLKSQQALVEHLRVDDAPTIKRGGRVEALTNLRVRLVSV
jgi:hypothetical protein